MEYSILKNPYEYAKAELASLVKEACLRAISDGALPETDLPDPPCEEPNDAQNGDLSSTFALILAKPMRSAPRKIAEEITRRMDLRGTLFRTVSGSST